MTLTEVRQAVMTVIGQIVADHRDYPLKVETTNRDPIDQATQMDPYLQVTVAPMGGEAAELGRNPMVKQSGQILLAAVVKDGAGEADALALIDFVLPYFSTKDFGNLHCEAGHAVGGRLIKGLWYQPAIVPFYHFSKPA